MRHETITYITSGTEIYDFLTDSFFRCEDYNGSIVRGTCWFEDEDGETVFCDRYLTRSEIAQMFKNADNGRHNYHVIWQDPADNNAV